MRKKLFAANWKMHHGLKEAQSFAADFLKVVSPDVQKEWVIFPPATLLATLATLFKDSVVRWGGQNCHWEQKGAFTGEISPTMLKDLKCKYTLVGHSERRQFFGETDETCAKKITALGEVGITPLFCVGETQKERDDAQTEAVLKRQLTDGLKTWTPADALVVAYEPVWAIGTGKVASPAMAEEAHQVIRRILTTITGSAQRAAEIQILYGGSVKPDNCRELIPFPNIDGFLIGGASLEAKTFAQIGQVPL